MNKHVLIIGGGRPVHIILKELGVKLTALSEIDRIARVLKADDKLYDRVIGMPDNSRIEDWIQMAIAINGIDKIDCIGCYSEENLMRGALIAEKLGLPFHSVETIETVNNKYKMREILKLHGLDSTECAKVDTVEDIIMFGNANGYPIILKPIDGTASTGVSIIHKENDIEKATSWFKEGTENQKMYVETFIYGEEYSVEAFSENNVHKVICITKKYKEEEHFVEIGHCVPAIISENTESIICEYIREVLSVVGIKNGVSHTEIILTPDGPRIVEVHARLAGDNIADLVKVSTGIDIEEMIAKQTLNESVINNIPEIIPKNKFSSIWYAIPKKMGILEDVRGMSEANASKSVERVEIIQKTGRSLDALHNSFSRLAFAIATGSSSDEAIENAKNAIGKLEFVIK